MSHYLIEYALNQGTERMLEGEKHTGFAVSQSLLQSWLDHLWAVWFGVSSSILTFWANLLNGDGNLYLSGLLWSKVKTLQQLAHQRPSKLIHINVCFPTLHHKIFWEHRKKDRASLGCQTLLMWNFLVLGAKFTWFGTCVHEGWFCCGC